MRSIIKTFLVLGIVFGFLLSTTNGHSRKKLDRKNIESMNDYNTALISTNRIEKINLLKKALHKWPKNYEAIIELGKTYLEENNIDYATEYLSKAVNCKDIKTKLTALKTFYKYYNVTLKGKDSEKVAHWLERIIKYEDNFINNYNLGVLHGPEKLSNLEKSTTYFLKALELKPEHKIIHYYIAKNYFHTNHFEKSIYHLKKYPNTNKDHQNAFLLYVKALFQRAILNPSNHNSILALREINRYLTIWPNDNEIKSFRSHLSDKTSFSTKNAIPVSGIKKSYSDIKVTNIQRISSITKHYYVNVGYDYTTAIDLKRFYKDITKNENGRIIGNITVKIFPHGSSTYSSSKPILTTIINRKSTKVNFKRKIKVPKLKIEFSYTTNEDNVRSPSFN